VTKTPRLFGACDGETAPRRGVEIDPAAGKCVIADDLSFAADDIGA
jgi:hypothetical protein